MSVNKKIAWEKFIAPYNEEESVIEEMHDPELDSDDEEEGEYTAHDITNFVTIEDLLINKQIKTPFGMYEINDPFSPYNMFECWIGHTNFRITKLDFDILNTKIDGIGCLKILSPYRFFIGIEKMFNFPTVRVQIQKDLCNNLDIESNIPVEYSADDIISKLNDALFNIKDSQKWAVFVGSDGKIMTIKDSEFATEIDYQNELKCLKLQKNGNIITYDSL